jgi:natural product biosynthesis luciferase-like monooxygenase protein
MRFGAHYLPTYIPELDGTPAEFYRRMFEQMELLDAVGFDDIWVTEHHFNEYGGMISNPPTFLAAVARTTQRAHLGVAISVLPFHNPLLIAEAYGMVDVISNGRLELGIGRGSTPREYGGFGLTQDDSPTRMREAGEIIESAWSNETLEYHGQIFNYGPVRVLPKPVQRPHPPIWVGASRSDDTFRWAGKKGFNLMTLPYMYEPDQLKYWIDIYRDSLVEAGHDPSTREILGKFHVYVAESDSKAREEAQPYLANYERVTRMSNTSGHPAANGVIRDRHDIEHEIKTGNVIAGDPTRVIEIIEGWREALGLTTISGTIFFGGLPQELTLRNIRMYAEKVMPHFRTGAQRTAASPTVATA